MDLDERLCSLQKMKTTLDTAWLLAFKSRKLTELEELAFYCNVVAIKLSSLVEAIRRAACATSQENVQE